MQIPALGTKAIYPPKIEQLHHTFSLASLDLCYDDLNSLFSESLKVLLQGFAVGDHLVHGLYGSNGS